MSVERTIANQDEEAGESYKEQESTTKPKRGHDRNTSHDRAALSTLGREGRRRGYCRREGRGHVGLVGWVYRRRRRPSFRGGIWRASLDR